LAPPGSPRIFFLYRDAPERRAALLKPLGAPDRYRLFGLDEVASRGADVRHNLERAGPPPVWARVASRAINRSLSRLGGYGGDFASVLACLRELNRADVVFSTVDTVGLPLMLLKRARLVRPHVVYVAIGLPERLDKLGSDRMRRLYARALGDANAIVTYAQSEADRLRQWLGVHAPSVLFIPFGVDVDVFRPLPEAAEVDVLSVGADPRRDFELLLAVARRRPDLSFRIVAGADHARSLRGLPSNVELETDIPLEQVRDRLARARVVVLPVRDNSYSGATTVLLQAMAMAKPVVVSRTAAISTGYGLEDGVNCRLVAPGDVAAFERATLELVTDAGAASLLGAHARDTVVSQLSWKRYTDALWEVLSAVRSVTPRP
jgi:glycosyltransferase involved in cell wall biosynthesis